MNKTEAAALLSLEVDEVVDVADSPAGTLIKTHDNQTYIVVPDDNPDAEGKAGVMYLSAPSEQYGGSFPVFAQPGAGEDADEFRNELETFWAGRKLDEAAGTLGDLNEAEDAATAEALVTDDGRDSDPVAAPGPEHAEAVEEATAEGAGQKAKEQAKKQGATARSAAKKA